MDKINFLRKTPLFAGLNEEAVVEASQHVFEKQLKRGELIMNDTGDAKVLYFVAEGVMKAYKLSADGKEQVLALMRPGDFFNEIVLDDGPALANIEALGAALLYGIQKESMHIIVEKNPSVTDNLLTMLTWRIRYLISLVEDLSFRTVSSRVAKILLENARAVDKARLTQRDMAGIAGTAREVVSRSLKYMENRGLIEMRKRQIILKDIEGLTELSAHSF